MDDVQDYLMRQDRDVLVDLIMDKAMDDALWRDYLLRKTASQQAETLAIQSWWRSSSGKVM